MTGISAILTYIVLVVMNFCIWAKTFVSISLRILYNLMCIPLFFASTSVVLLTKDLMHVTSVQLAPLGREAPRTLLSSPAYPSCPSPPPSRATNAHRLVLHDGG